MRYFWKKNYRGKRSVLSFCVCYYSIEFPYTVAGHATEWNAPRGRKVPATPRTWILCCVAESCNMLNKYRGSNFKMLQKQLENNHNNNSRFSLTKSHNYFLIEYSSPITCCYLRIFSFKLFKSYFLLKLHRKFDAFLAKLSYYKNSPLP